MSVEISIPFCGLYESWLSKELDHEEEQFSEHIAESEESAFPEPLRISAQDLCECVFGAMNYSVAHESLARAYLDAFDCFAGEALGETRPYWIKQFDTETRKYISRRINADSIGATFSIMTSPKYYNFESDRLFANVSFAFVKRLFKMSKSDKHETLAKVIRERFTSYDGFISHYRNDLQTWLSKPLAEWDYNELGTLLIACLTISGGDTSDESFFYAVLEGETGSNALNAGLDFNDFESRRLDKRVELLVDWIQSDPESVAKYRANHSDEFAAIVAHDPSEFEDLEEFAEMAEGDEIGSFYRCKETPDLFETVQ